MGNSVILFVLSSLFFVIFPSQAYVREVFSALRARSFCSQWHSWLRPPSVADHVQYSIFSTEGPSLSFKKKKKHVCADFRGLLFGRAASALVFSEGFLQAEEKEKVSKQKQYAYSPCFGGLSV